MSALTTADGKATLPASALVVRYGVMRPASEQNMWKRSTHFDYINGLATMAPESAKTVPIWLTAETPADAQPGLYKGTLTITTARAPAVTVPVELSIAQWLCPKPADMTVRWDMVQSPDAVANAYQVPLYSDKHFALMEKTFQLMGQYPSRLAWVPLVEDGLQGQTQSMVRYGKKADGTWQIDYSIMDRYLDLQARYCGAPKAIAFITRGLTTGDLKASRRNPNIDPAALPKPVMLTTLDGTGEEPLTNWTAEADALWKQTFDGIRQRIVKRGWKDEIIMIGLSSESQPSQRFVDMFQKAAPYARWVNVAHDHNIKIVGVPVGYSASVRGETQWSGIAWENPRESLHYGYSITFSTPLVDFHGYLEGALAGRYRGIGKMGADFWSVAGKGRPEFWQGGQPTMMWGMSYPCIFMAGPAGAEHSMHSLLGRESVQECEAKVQLLRTLADKAANAKLGDALAKRCRAVLGERDAARNARERTYEIGGIGYVTGAQRRASDIYECAAQVAQAIGQ